MFVCVWRVFWFGFSWVLALSAAVLHKLLNSAALGTRGWAASFPGGTWKLPMSAHVALLLRRNGAEIGFNVLRAPQNERSRSGSGSCCGNLRIISEAKFGCVSTLLEVNQP